VKKKDTGSGMLRLGLFVFGQLHYSDVEIRWYDIDMTTDIFIS